MTKIIYNENDNLIVIEGLRDTSTPGGYLNAATVTATLNDSTGAPISGATNISCNYVSGSNGDYEGTIQSTVSLVNEPGYTLVVDSDEGGAVGHWELEAEVIVRRG
jgi:hypothetical protein